MLKRLILVPLQDSLSLPKPHAKRLKVCDSAAENSRQDGVVQRSNSSADSTKKLLLLSPKSCRRIVVGRASKQRGVARRDRHQVKKKERKKEWLLFSIRKARMSREPFFFFLPPPLQTEALPNPCPNQHRRHPTSEKELDRPSAATVNTSLFYAVEKAFRTDLESFERAREERERRRKEGLAEYDTQIMERRRFLPEEERRIDPQRREKSYRARLMLQPREPEPESARLPAPPPPGELAVAVRTAAWTTASEQRAMVRVDYCKRREERRRRMKAKGTRILLLPARRCKTRLLEQQQQNDRLSSSSVKESPREKADDVDVIQKRLEGGNTPPTLR